MAGGFPPWAPFALWASAWRAMTRLVGARVVVAGTAAVGVAVAVYILVTGG